MVLVFHQEGDWKCIEEEEYQAAGRGGVVVPVCVCTLFMGHIGYISLKTKNNIFFFIIKSFRKN